MGYPCSNLIPPAILLDNPGITREEFAELLNQTYPNPVLVNYNVWNKGGALDLFISYPRFHQGVFSVALILGLEQTEEYRQRKRSIKNSEGISIPEPRLGISEQIDPVKGIFPTYDVIVHDHTEVFHEKEIHDYSSDKLEVGDIWEEPIMGMETGVVTEIFQQTHYLREEYEDSSPEFFYVMRIKPFKIHTKEINFVTLDSMVKEFPEFDPDHMFDFSQEQGNFHIGIANESEFLWRQNSGKYYLDHETYNKILPGGFGFRGGYSGLVATAEAIKQNAWRLLSYRGDKYLPEFVKDFPESGQRYAKAVWDAQTSLAAKLQGLSNFEFLRYRLEPPNV